MPEPRDPVDVITDALVMADEAPDLDRFDHAEAAHAVLDALRAEYGNGMWGWPIDGLVIPVPEETAAERERRRLDQRTVKEGPNGPPPPGYTYRAGIYPPRVRHG